MGGEPGRTVRPLAAPGRRVRVLLRLPRRGDEPVVPGDLREHDADRAVGHPRGRLPLHGRHDGQGDRLDAPAEGAGPGPAVLHVLRAGRHARSAPRPEGLGGPLPGEVRPGLGRRPRGDVRPAEGARRDPRRRRADRAQPRHPGVGRDVGADQAGAGEGDGGVRRVPVLHRPPHRPADRRHRGDGDRSTTR